MSLYRWFKTQVYWLIPSSFKSTNTSEFNTNDDLVTIFKATETDGVYQNRQVSINQLTNLINGQPGPTSFDVATDGQLTVSVNEGPYSAGPSAVELGDKFTLAAQNLPTNLNWMGEWSNTQEYTNSDVVFNISGGVYTTWIYIDEDPSTGQALPVAPNTFNTYWAQLGTQGPSGSNGVTQLNGLLGNVTIQNDGTLFAGGNWSINNTIDGNTIKQAITKPYKEYSTRFVVSGNSSVPAPSYITSAFQGMSINDFSGVITSSTVSVTSPFNTGITGLYWFTFPSAVFSVVSGKNEYSVSIEKDNGLRYNTPVNKQYSVKYNLDTSGGLTRLVFQLFKFDETLNDWVSGISSNDAIFLRVSVKVYN
jgi:hypothetical protein